MYLVVLDVVVSVLLFKEGEDGRQRPVFFVNKSLADVETRHNHLEQVISKKLIEFLVHFSDFYYNVIACFYAEICTIYQIYILQKFIT